jgi:hypothetical protein
MLGLLMVGLWVTKTKTIWSHKAYGNGKLSIVAGLATKKILLPSLWQSNFFYCHMFDFGCKFGDQKVLVTKLAVIRKKSSLVVW